MYELISQPDDDFGAAALRIAGDAAAAKQDHIAFAMAQFAGTGKEHTSNADTKKTLANSLTFAAYPKLRSWLQNGPDTPTTVDLLSGNVDLFIQMPTNQIKAHPAVVRLILGAIYLLLDHHEGLQRSGRHWVFMLDEANALGRMPVLEATRDEGRAKGLHLVQMFQSYQQLEEHYGKAGASAWQQGTDLRIWGPVSDHESARALAAMIGQESVKTVSANTRHSSNAMAMMPTNYGGGTSENLRDMALMDEAELGSLPPETIIVFRAGLRPFIAAKAVWFTRKAWTDMVAQAKERFAPPTPQTPLPTPTPPVKPRPSDLLNGVGGTGTPAPREDPCPDPKSLVSAPSSAAEQPDEDGTRPDEMDLPDADQVLAVMKHAADESDDQHAAEATLPLPFDNPSENPSTASHHAEPTDTQIPDDDQDNQLDHSDGDAAEGKSATAAGSNGDSRLSQQDSEASIEAEREARRRMVIEQLRPPSRNPVPVTPVASRIEPPEEPTSGERLAATVKAVQGSRKKQARSRSEAAEVAHLTATLPQAEEAFDLFGERAAAPPKRAGRPARARNGEAGTPALAFEVVTQPAEPVVSSEPGGIAVDVDPRPEELKEQVAADPRGEDPYAGLMQKIFDRTTHYTLMSSLLHVRAPIPKGSKVEAIAKTLPQSENAEVARTLPGALVEGQGHVDRQSIIVLEAHHFMRYVLSADLAKIEHEIGPIAIDDVMRKQYLRTDVMAQVTERIRNVGALQYPEDE